MVQTKKLIEIAPYMGLFLFSVMFVFLIRQNMQMRAQLNGLLGGSTNTASLKHGDLLKPVDVQWLDGTKSTLTYDSTANYLIFITSPTCPHCARNLVHWRKLTAEPFKNCKVLGMTVSSVDEARAYSQADSLPFPLVSVTDTSFRSSYKVVGFPETIVVGPKMRVEKTYVGEMTMNQVEEIRAYLSGPETSAR